MRVLLTDTYLGEPELERDLLHENGMQLIVAADGSPAGLTAHPADGILNCVSRIPAEVIEAMPNLRAIARYGIGVDNIDVEAATRAGVLVSNVPDYSIDEVATHAIAMILSCARQLRVYHASIRSGAWEWRTTPPLRRLSSQTLGILGLGRIGSAVARKATALGMTVLAHDPAVSAEAAADIDVEMTAPEDVLRRADYLSLHVPLTPETTRLVDARALTLLRPTAYLINVSRGPLVDLDALLEALDQGRLAGAALDVFPEEPLPAASSLAEHPKLLLTPHAAWYSTEALEEARIKAVHSIIGALRGERPRYLINPEVLERGGSRDSNAPG